jgi:glycosyltransferase involved in cell wall biosynthesis
MASSRGLLVVNHVMDDADPYLSHQSEVVRLLASQFPHITVITGRVGSFVVPNNVTVINTNWKPGRKFRNILSFLRIAIPRVFSPKYSVLFSHMADLQAGLIAPFARLGHKRHFLWYAHSHKSFYLSWASVWITGIISSTSGSCPLTGEKISLIGQSVNPRMFPPRELTSPAMNRLIHVGRLDRSKNIDLLIQSTLEIRKLNPSTSLTLIGSSANSESSSYYAELNKKYIYEIQNNIVCFIPSIPRDQLSVQLLAHDIFIHAYKGSLDKTLVEATFSCMPVITINPEYESIFGTWSNRNSPTLYEEYSALYSRPKLEILKELSLRLSIAKSSHSSDQWIQKLSEILQAKSRPDSISGIEDLP